MKFCPKCKIFSDDENLKFCLNDGMYLINIDQSNELWISGTNSIREAKRFAKREIVKRQIIKIISLMITTTLVIMVISVITLNSWIYFNEPEKESVKLIEPSPIIEQTPIIEPTITPETVETIEPTPTATATATVTPTTTITPIPTPKTTPTPDSCSLVKQKEFENRIEARYSKIWRNKFLTAKNSNLATQKQTIINDCMKRINNPAGCQNLVQTAEINLAATPNSKVIKTDKLCKFVNAQITFNWTFTTSQFAPKTFSQTMSFKYPIK